MQNTLLANAKELVKSSYLKLLFIFLMISFSGCQDKGFISTTYNEKLLSQPTGCLKLVLKPYSKEVYDAIKTLHDFDLNCTRILEIKYKTKIVCTSQFNTNKEFTSYVELNLLENNKSICTLYKDLKDENITDEIIKGYKLLCKKINL